MFGHLDRCMVEFEMCLWNANEVLGNVEYAGAFSDRLASIRRQIEALAREAREYNDKLEGIEPQDDIRA